jgi:hypothetical protein
VCGLRVYDYVESERGKFCQYDDAIGWIGKANAHDDFQVRHNPYGFRGPAYETARSAEPRFAVLGDSFVWGFGVEEQDIFTSVMERESARPIEVVNLGVSGYGTDQELLLWERTGRLWRPDHLLLLVTLANDLDEILVPVAHDYAKPVFRAARGGGLAIENVPVPPRQQGWREPDRETRDEWKLRLPGFLRRSAVVNVAFLASARFPALKRLFDDVDLLPRRRGERDWALPQYLVPQPPAREKAWDLLARILARLKADAARDGADLTVVAIPSIIEAYPEMWEKAAARHSEFAGHLDPDLPQRTITEICERLNISLVDLLPPLREAARTDGALYFPLNLHWTPDGHRTAAQALLAHFGLRGPRTGEKPGLSRR